MVKTIAIQNPRVLEIVARERTHGAGRSVTEAAENLILAEAERREGQRSGVPIAKAPKRDKPARSIPSESRESNRPQPASA